MAVLTALVVVAVGAAVGARPVLRRVRRARAERLVAAADHAWARRDWQTSGNLLADAERQCGACPGVLRGLARHYAHYRSSYALNYFEMLEQSGSSVRDDRVHHVRAALSLGRTDIARRLLKPLHSAAPKDPEILLLVSETFELDGDLESARGSAEDALAAGAEGARVELRLGTLELTSPVVAEKLHGRSRLLAAVGSYPSVRAEAALLLLEREPLAPGDVALLMRLVPDGADASIDERAVHLMGAIRSRPAEAVASARRFCDAADLEKILPRLAYIAELLGRAGEPRAVAEIVSEPLALRDGNLLRLRLGALVRLGEVEAATRLFTGSADLLPDAERVVFRAGLAQMSGPKAEAEGLWRLASGAVRSSPSLMEMLARHAEMAGAPDIAIEALLGILQDPVLAPRAAAQVLRLAGSLRPEAARAALSRLVASRPDRTALRLSLAYFQILLKVDLVEAEAVLALGEGAFADKGLYQIVSVLSALDADRTDQAAQRLAGSDIDWGKAPPAWRAVRVAALGRSGQNFAAREVAAGIDVSRLSLSERQLIADWLPKLR